MQGITRREEKGTKGEKAVKSIINVKVCYMEGRKTSVYLQITRSGAENTTGGHKRIRIGFRSEFDERERERESSVSRRLEILRLKAFARGRGRNSGSGREGKTGERVKSEGRRRKRG